MAKIYGLAKKAIQQTVTQKKPSNLTPWKPDERWPQPYYLWDTEGNMGWQPIKRAPQTTLPVLRGVPSSEITSLALYSWNIDFMLPHADARMSAALSHLEKLTDQSPSTTAIAINLQECTPSDLINISQQQWVRDRFCITDLDCCAWGSDFYGTTTLVDRRLEIESCFRVHYSASNMERDALFVDFMVPNTSHRVRLGNTHLESLPLDPPLRPSQMRIAATHLHAEEVSAAIIAGDFNAIQPFDSFLHSDNGLKDAYLELGGREGREEGFTWGQQALPALRERFGCSRMDKAFFCGEKIKLQSFERFGADVEVDGEKTKQKNALLALGFEKAWCTDHIGIKVIFNLVNDTQL